MNNECKKNPQNSLDSVRPREGPGRPSGAFRPRPRAARVRFPLEYQANKTLRKITIHGRSKKNTKDVSEIFKWAHVKIVFLKSDDIISKLI